MTIPAKELDNRPESAHWIWNIPDDTINMGWGFYSFLNLNRKRNIISLNRLLDFFQDKEKETVKRAFDNFLLHEGKNELNFEVTLNTPAGNITRLKWSGETLSFDSGKPTIVSGCVSFIPVKFSNVASIINDSYFLDLLMGRLPYSIFFKDDKSRFIKISSECAKKFGLSDPEEAVGKTDYDFFDKSHAEPAFRDEQRILETGKPIVEKIEEEVQPGNPPVTLWASTTKLPLYDKNSKIIGTFGITKDITTHIKAEQALKESEKKYRSIFENIQDVYYRTNRLGIVTEISPSIEGYSGYKREEIIGNPVSNFYYYQKDREKLIEKLKNKGIVTDFEVRLANAGNKLMYTSVSAKIVRNDADEIVAVEGIMRDITERKTAELKLKETHNFFDQILNNTSEGIYVVNSSYEYIYWNSMMESISGMSSGEVLGKKPFDLFSHVNHEKLIATFRKAMSGETVKSNDYYYEIATTGKKGWAQAYYTPLRSKDGEIESVLVAVSDITVRKLAEKKLRESDETLTKLSEQVPGAIYQFQQFPDGAACFPFASSAIHSVYEVSPEDIRHDASKAIERIHPEDLDLVVKSINKSFHTLEPWELDYRVVLPANGVRWLRGRARPEKQPDNSVIWNGYISDVTEKKKQEVELHETLNIVSDQNSRLLNFAHIVSHNLRNHAGNISSLLSLYESENSEEERLQLLNYLNMASNRLNEAINDLNKIIDQQAGTSKSVCKVNVYDYFLKIKEILSTDIIINNVTFDTSIPEDFELDYNPAYLESILLNLISNAIKYRHPDRPPVIKVSLKTNEKFPELVISDNGIGVDLNKHGDKLFGMYNTFHNNDDSKGIGLYITKNQVESMGGTIAVESIVDEGTQFNITLNCDPSRINLVSH